jgi:adenylate cyclase
MLTPLRNAELVELPTAHKPGGGLLVRLARSHPFLVLFFLVILSNGAGSFFNFAYNTGLIVKGYLDEKQREIFWQVAAPIYNFLAYPICLAITVYLLWPLVGCRRDLLAGQRIEPTRLEFCRRRLVNLPYYLLVVNFLGWFPGAFFFPAIICWLGGTHEALWIWVQFFLSFFVAALFTTVQTFFILEAFLTRFLYPDFFADARPAEVEGVHHISFRTRLRLLWMAVAVMPLVALLVVAGNFLSPLHDKGELVLLAWAVGLVGAFFGGFIFWIGGYNILQWIRAHEAATEELKRENFDYRIADKRPDEWGKLTDRFNDMAAELGRGKEVRETLGQVVGPDVGEVILKLYPGDGSVHEITVLFADIRGFTRRSSGQAPQNVVSLLNRFFSLAFPAVEEKGGLVNKCLGDGFMALFGAIRKQDVHADQAVASALDLLDRLQALNQELAAEGQSPLEIGIGIHTGPVLVGCVGAAMELPDGRRRTRKEFTAIGETVNLCQRLEQLTKTCGGPVLISEQTRRRLQNSVPLREVGPQRVPGSDEAVVVYQVLQQSPL